jgi:hypothetical protein
MAEDKPDGYGDRWMKWAAIYLVAGAIVYFIVYLVFFHHGGGYGGGGSGGGTGGRGYLTLPLLWMSGWRLSGRGPGRRSS